MHLSTPDCGGLGGGGHYPKPDKHLHMWATQKQNIEACLAHQGCLCNTAPLKMLLIISVHSRRSLTDPSMFNVVQLIRHDASETHSSSDYRNHLSSYSDN